MAPLILTMVRHGESLDNITSLWAGHKDAALTVHGFNQAQRLGKHFKEVPITAIYTSDLKRAHTTAKSVHDSNLTKPPFTVSPVLREQFFGAAEGQPWDVGAYTSTHLPWEDHRAFRLAEQAESLTEVGNRATSVLRHFLLPHILSSATRTDREAEHVMLFAHGIFLSEMMFALKRAGIDPNVRFIKSSGYTNTGWSRVELSFVDPEKAIRDLEEAFAAAEIEDNTDLKHTGIPTTYSNPEPSSITPTTFIPLPPRHDTLPPSIPHNEIPIPPLKLKVLALNQVEHLEGLERQKGGIGSSGYDPNQKSVKDFFSGAAAKGKGV